MIEVLEKGRKKTITCDGCGAVLSYDNADVNNYFRFPLLFRSRPNQAIKCPQCKNIIHIKEG